MSSHALVLRRALPAAIASDPTPRSSAPARPSRRFDLFAEYREQAEQPHGMAADRGYGLWAAKLVAARKFGRLGEAEQLSVAEAESTSQPGLAQWRLLEPARREDT